MLCSSVLMALYVNVLYSLPRVTAATEELNYLFSMVNRNLKAWLYSLFSCLLLNQWSIKIASILSVIIWFSGLQTVNIRWYAARPRKLNSISFKLFYFLGLIRINICLYTKCIKNVKHTFSEGVNTRSIKHLSNFTWLLYYFWGAVLYSSTILNWLHFYSTFYPLKFYFNLKSTHAH